MKTQVKTITPQEATKIIEEHDKLVTNGELKQRNVRESIVNQFAADITAGNWLLSHQGIAFDKNNNLIDGQHRLRAVIKANKSITTLVTTELEDIMDVIDSGFSRPLYQQLSISHGYTNTTEHVSIARGLIIFICNTSIKISTKQFLAFYEPIKPVVEELFTIIPNKKNRTQMFASPWLLYYTVSRTKARQFANKFYTLEECEKGNPALLLNRYLFNLSNQPRRSFNTIMQVTANALQLFHTNEVVTTLKGSREARHWLLEKNKELVVKVLDVLGLPTGDKT